MNRINSPKSPRHYHVLNRLSVHQVIYKRGWHMILITWAMINNVLIVTIGEITIAPIKCLITRSGTGLCVRTNIFNIHFKNVAYRQGTLWRSWNVDPRWIGRRWIHVIQGSLVLPVSLTCWIICALTRQWCEEFQIAH